MSEATEAALKSAILALDDWTNTYAPELCDEERVKQAQARHFLALELGVNQRKLGLQQGVQLPKFVGIELGVIAR